MSDTMAQSQPETVSVPKAVLDGVLKRWLTRVQYETLMLLGIPFPDTVCGMDFSDFARSTHVLRENNDPLQTLYFELKDLNYPMPSTVFHEIFATDFTIRAEAIVELWKKAPAKKKKFPYGFVLCLMREDPEKFVGVEHLSETEDMAEKKLNPPSAP